MPATGNFVLDKGYDSASTLTKFRAVKQTANAEEVTACTVLGEDGLGVSQFGISAAELAKAKGASVRIEGITEWEASGVIARGAEVSVAADGRAVLAATGNRIWGRALQAASGAGVRISVLLNTAKPVKP